MDIIYHRQVQSDINKILKGYQLASEELVHSLDEDFFIRFMKGIELITENPHHCHFNTNGLRRYNLTRFPFHFLYDTKGNNIRIWVLRHNKQKPSFGSRRFKR